MRLKILVCICILATISFPCTGKEAHIPNIFTLGKATFQLNVPKNWDSNFVLDDESDPGVSTMVFMEKGKGILLTLSTESSPNSSHEKLANNGPKILKMKSNNEALLFSSIYDKKSELEFKFIFSNLVSEELAQTVLRSFVFVEDRSSTSETKNTNAILLPFQAEATSRILGSPIVFSFLVEEIHANFPIDDMPSGHNPWSLTGKIEKIYKGSLANAAGARFETTVSIYFGAVRSHPGGLWLNEQPNEGQRWLVLCQSKNESNLAQHLLRDKGTGCAVFKFKEVEADLMAIQDIFQRKLSLNSAIVEAIKHSHELTWLYFEFFIQYFKKELLNHYNAFEKLVDILENNKLQSTSRFSLASEIESVLLVRDTDPAMDPYFNRMIVSYFRLLARKDLLDEHYNILETSLPNYLGIEGGLKKRTAKAVFKAYRSDKEKIIKTLNASPHKKEAKRLLEWFKES